MTKRLICGDNLDVLNSNAIDAASVDLVYLDPPFNSDQHYNLPFTKLGKDSAAVEAFKDIWSWDETTRELEKRLKAEHATIALSTYINDVKMIRGGEDSLSAYLVNMAIRLNALKRVMKSSASIYLHCDPTAGHYLKMMMDGIFGHKHFQNEIIWKRSSSHNRAKRWGPVHDLIFFYTVSDEYTWNRTFSVYDPAYLDSKYHHKDKLGRVYRLSDLTGPGTRTGDSGETWKEVNPTTYGRHWEPPHDRALPHWFRFPQGWSSLSVRQRLDLMYEADLIQWPKKIGGRPEFRRYLETAQGQPIQDVISDIDPVNSMAMERLGYPTQKPIALLERIIEASSKGDGTVLDPFCGCGTAVHAAEKLHRNWIGIDISRFSVGVVKNRLAESFEGGILKQISISGIPLDVESALALAHEDPWEFEKWACGQLGAKGLYKRPGAKGADGGIDGVIEFYADPVNKSYAIVQVKGGNVKPNDVKALYSDVDDEPLATAGVFVCFDKYRRTALNSVSAKTFKDKIAGNVWPVIQVLTIEQMLAGAMPKLPNQVIQQGFRTNRAQPTLL